MAVQAKPSQDVTQGATLNSHIQLNANSSIKIKRRFTTVWHQRVRSRTYVDRHNPLKNFTARHRLVFPLAPRSPASCSSGVLVVSGFDEPAGGCGRDGCGADDVLAGFASLWSSAFNAMALKSPIIINVTTRNARRTSVALLQHAYLLVVYDWPLSRLQHSE